MINTDLYYLDLGPTLWGTVAAGLVRARILGTLNLP